MSEVASSRRGVVYWSFVLLMLALTGLFFFLGTWQMERLGEKETLIATVAERIGAPPLPLPPPDQWASLDPTALEYAPLEARGHFLPDQSVRVFTSLSNARGRYSGPGHWHISPFVLETGGTLLVNRGFVPQEPKGLEMTPPPEGTLTITGVARLNEAPDAFTPAPETANRVEWVRDVARLAAFLPADLAPYFPMSLDLPAAAAGQLPQGGETVVEFPNNHFGYALTWYGFGILTPIMLIFWMRGGRRGPRPRPD